MTRRVREKTILTDEPIAIIGVGCRFPEEINDAETFWKFLSEGKDAITEIPSDRWNVDKFYAEQPGIQGKYYSRHGGFIRDIHAFDAGFFGISPREAKQMDPHQKILLEVAWQAIEDAGLIVKIKKSRNINYKKLKKTIFPIKTMEKSVRIFGKWKNLKLITQQVYRSALQLTVFLMC